MGKRWVGKHRKTGVFQLVMKLAHVGEPVFFGTPRVKENFRMSLEDIKRG